MNKRRRVAAAPEKKAVFVRGVDAEAWGAFRGLCLRRGQSLGERINQLVARDLREEKRER